jgi:multiple sugar transport system substrate-binding protein
MDVISIGSSMQGLYPKSVKSNQMKKYISCLSSIFLVILVACAGFPQGGTAVPSETTAPTETAPPSVTSTPALPSPEATNSQVILTIWLPPQFDPDSDSLAGSLLQARLNEFSKRRPGVRIVTRIKAMTGPGGLLDSLTTASAAAPLAVPDLIALPYDLMEAAALKGLLHPYDNLTTVLDEPDWYGYAQELAHLQGSIYGLPFAGDALVLVQRSDVGLVSPVDWATVLELQKPLGFPAADPLALFSIALYQANGGVIRDEQGRPFLDAVILSEVLEFFAQAVEVDVMPYWLTQYQADEQIWEAFQENRTDVVATWISHYLAEPLENASITPLPTPNGDLYTLADGWVWGLSTRQDVHTELAIELAEFLTASSFLAAWTDAAGYLPPRSTSLNAWTEASLQETIGPISSSAHLLPTADILTSVGVPMQQATVQILKQQDDPVTAAQAAATSLTAP